MKTFPFALACFVLSSIALQADVMPFGGAKRPLPLRMELLAEKFRMEAAEVQVQIAKPKSLWRALGGGKEVCATVTSRFKLVRDSSDPISGEPQFGFPVHSGRLFGAKIESFKVTMNGKQIESVRQNPLWLDRPDGSRDILEGFRWAYAPGNERTLDVAVSYRLILPGGDGAKIFEYILRSGALWAGPIGKETVRITAEDGLLMTIDPEMVPAPARKSSSELVWELNSVEPQKDILVSVH